MACYDPRVCGQDDRLITYNDMTELIKDWNGMVIDVRTRKEIQETGSVPSSVNIPLNELEDALNMSYEDFSRKYQHEKPDRFTKIIFMCNSGRRSSTALRIALGLGFVNLYNYIGGWADWQAHVQGQKDANESESD